MYDCIAAAALTFLQGDSFIVAFHDANTAVLFCDE
jgi:hypothetical protein